MTPPPLRLLLLPLLTMVPVAAAAAAPHCLKSGFLEPKICGSVQSCVPLPVTLLVILLQRAVSLQRVGP